MATTPLPKRCSSCAPGTPALSDADADQYLGSLPGWQRSGKVISKTFSFPNYHDTMAFVNATAWISHRENHHPDLEVGYNRCLVRYTTHAANGLTPNDFICATKIESLLTL
jgi:4a-hydroxytetrahydrobiopterin dehydratase